jgi:hypothetical protein
MVREHPTLSRPFRAAAWCLGVLAILFISSFLFVNRMGGLDGYAWGLGYCFFLTLFGIGFALAARSRLVLWWIVSGIVPAGMIVGFGLWLRSSPESILSLSQGAWWGMMGVLCTWVLAGCVVASYGWVEYIRSYRSTGYGRRGKAPTVQ